MITLTFNKKENYWYPQLPGQEPNKNKLEWAMNALNDALLEFLAWGKKKLTLKIDTQPFDNADVLRLVELCDAPKGGGYYILQSLRGRAFYKRLWLCDVPLFVFGDVPQEIYVQEDKRMEKEGGPRSEPVEKRRPELEEMI